MLLDSALGVMQNANDFVRVCIPRMHFRGGERGDDVDCHSCPHDRQIHRDSLFSIAKLVEPQRLIREPNSHVRPSSGAWPACEAPPLTLNQLVGPISLYCGTFLVGWFKRKRLVVAYCKSPDPIARAV
jgi:hypothetical protein